VDGSGTFTDVTFRNNSAGDGGGGIDAGNSTFTNVTFRNNTAGGSGGGVNMGYYSNNSTFTNVTFRGNSANRNGGGLNGRGTLANVTFRNNSANDEGGGMNGSGTLTDVTFRNNSANRGGGMYGRGTLTDVTFRENTSNYDGGGLYARSSVDLKKVTFRGNTAGNFGDGSGGGAYTSGSVRATGVRFIGNDADRDAGGLYIANSGEPISNAVFSGNQADGNGGALYIDTDSSPKIVNVSFTNNTAQQNGGTIYSTGTNSFPIVANSILWGNSATTGTEIYVNSGQPSVGSSIVEGGLPENVFDDGGNLDQDPLFVNPTGPDGVVGTADDSLQVQDGSPVIDAGDSSELPADSLDLDANGNTTETLPVDLAGNARQQDVVNTSPDGDFAVDMGAYEAEGELPDALADGDVDGSGDVSPNDASMTLQGFLDLITLSPAEQRAADYNSDDAVTPFDASLILQAYLGKGAPAALAKAESGSEGTVRLGDVSVEDGTATIPVMLSGEARRVQSVALNLSYESEVASVKSVTSTVPDGWMTNKNAKDDGSLTVGLAGASPVEGGRTIAEVRLSLSGGADDLSPEGSYRLNGSDTQSLNGTSAPSTPSEFSLEGNYPNPVQRSTTIEYQLAESAPVRITVYDMLGRRIQTLVDTRQEAGTHSVKWNRGGTSRGRVASGTYFYRIEAGDFTETRKMVVVR
jgi:predicted outer membrane repeat protein